MLKTARSYLHSSGQNTKHDGQTDGQTDDQTAPRGYYSGLQLRQCGRAVKCQFFSERELTFTFAIGYRSSSVRLSVGLSVTFVHPTYAIEIFRNICTLFGTLAIY